MAKDSYWFKHDSTAGRGTRMRKMTFIYGHWGKGVYWDVIEILREQDGYSFGNDELSLQMLADLIGCKDVQKFINWYNDCVKINLLQTSENVFFSEVLNENMLRWESKKNAGIQSATKRKQRNVNETSTEVPTKRQRNVKIREEKSIEDKIIEDNKHPSESEFLEYALLNKPNVDKQAVINKFKAWSGSGWFNGNGKKIKNWKSTLLNTLVYLPEIKTDVKKVVSNAKELK